MKFFFILIPLFLVGIILGSIFFRNHFVYSLAQGSVHDCKTNQPIENVEVSLNERGWGLINGSLVWDKDYSFKNKTDSKGFFKIEYRGSPTHIITTKEGYLTLDQWQEIKSPIDLKLIKGIDAKSNCK